MRSIVKLTGIIGLLVFLSACGGSNSGSTTTGPSTDLACSGATCRNNEVPSAPEPLTCGGIAGKVCPDGYHCVDDPSDTCSPENGADCGGTCVLGEELAHCGGLTGAACEPGFICADDPSDSCEGGVAVDCPGICRPQADGECATDADCPQVRVACSICADGTASCPHGSCNDGTCSVAFKPCPGPQRCGGIAGFTCEPGYTCTDDPTDQCDPNTGADCGGICVPEEKPRTCGGIAGIECPRGYECVDDPMDSCDAQTGGADCPSQCQPIQAAECTDDSECPQLRAACSVCVDGSSSCPKSYCENGKCNVVYPMCETPVICSDGTACHPGDICVPASREACDPATGVNCGSQCVPGNGSRPCGGEFGDTCPDGYECILKNCDPDMSGADCVGECQATRKPQCQSDEECPVILAPCTLCADGSFACPQGKCDAAGICSMSIGACSGQDFCGGIAGFPCPPGSTCIDNPRDGCDPADGGADCGGICVREDQPKSCGGFGGFPCADGYECVDDARDDCDPANGGADCPGVCKPAPSSECRSDSDCAVIAVCQICADGVYACPSAACTNGKCDSKFPPCAVDAVH